MILVAAVLLQAAPPSAGADPCRREERVGGATFVHFGPERECKAWRPVRRHTGVWVYGFEDSHFVEGATTLAEAEQAGWRGERVAWISYDERSTLIPGCRPILGQAYLVDFDGRDAISAKEPLLPFSGFGHMGLWSKAVLIDQVRSMRLLSALPGPQVRPKGVPTCAP